jgi:preprotein translocase SecE subunit
MGGMKVAEGEEEFERPESRPESATPAAISDATYRRIATAVALAAAFCVAASLYLLGTPAWPATQAPPVNVQMGVAGGAFLAMAWFVLAKLSPRLGYAKPGQGRWARLAAYVGFAVIALFGAVALHHVPGLGSKWFGGLEGLWTRRFLGAEVVLRPVFFPAAGLFLVSLVAFHLYLNRPKVGEFLIETQGEMRRVSWPTRREWVGSTVVVLCLVAVLSGFLYAADHFLSQLMQALKIGF